MVLCPSSNPPLARKFRLASFHSGLRRLGNRLHSPRSRDSGASLGGLSGRLPGQPRKGSAAKHIRAAVRPSHCGTAAPAQSPPPGRHMLPAPTAGGRPVSQPLGPGLAGPPTHTPSRRTRENESGSRSAPLPPSSTPEADTPELAPD